jgi:hypothetical protein
MDKGQQFERDVCRQLSSWVSGGTNANLFWRSSQSGGRATTLRKSGSDLSVHAGDIAAIDPAGHEFIDIFFIECKNYKSLHLDQLLYNVKGGLAPMWSKCKTQAASYKKVPLLILHENRRETLVCLPSWLTLGPNLVAWFPQHELCIGRFGGLEAINVTDFIRQGRSDARMYYGRLALNKPVVRQLSLGLLPLAGATEVPHDSNPRRPRRRKRLP